MKELVNYKLKKFLRKDPKLISEYLKILNFIKPCMTKNQIINLSLKDVEFIKRNINSSNDKDICNIIKLVQNCTDKELLNYRIIKFFAIWNSIKKQMEIIRNAEQNSLTPETSNRRWEMVNGSEQMAKFGIYNTLEALTKGDVTKYAKVMEMEYSEIFTILYMKRVQSDLQSKMNKIK